MKIPKEDAVNIAWGDPPEDIQVIQSELIDTTRWSQIHELVIKKDDKYYSKRYSIGATEYQDEGPFDNEGPFVEFNEVEPYEHTVIKYRRIF